MLENILHHLKELLKYQPEHPMIFTTALFWGFFGLVLLVFQLTYQKRTARNLFLFAFSLFFYYKSSGYFFCLLLLTTVIDYVMGWQIFRADSKALKKFYVFLSLCMNLGLLSYFKYAYFLSGFINSFFGTAFEPVDYLAYWTNYLTDSNLDITHILLPVGISFYTFQSISYSIDIYRGVIKPVNSFLDFAFFVSFFPQLVAGPIVRASEFVPQIYKPYDLTRPEFNRAVFLILTGLVKKILISDYISSNFVDRVFESPVSYTGFENLMSVYGYTIQIYCDFSGYTDIAIGVALLLGFRLSTNFNAPYISQNITEFWRRWHISLSTWLKDYLYISLGGNRKGKVRQYVNLFITMLLGGLWHGAHIKFLIWGALHGLALAFHKLWMELTGTDGKAKTFLGKFWAQLLTFHFVAFCWIFFRADNLEIVKQVLRQITYHFEPQLVPQMVVAYKAVFSLMLFAYLIHFIPVPQKNRLGELFGYIPDLAKAAVIVVIILGLYQVKTAAIQPFIYFQF
jgi:alginate O-acetyltransferase complex protein AlgI